MGIVIIPNDLRRIVPAASLWFKNALSARLWFEEGKKTSGWISQRKDLAIGERQSYGLKPARLRLKSQHYHYWNRKADDQVNPTAAQALRLKAEGLG